MATSVVALPAPSRACLRSHLPALLAARPLGCPRSWLAVFLAGRVLGCRSSWRRWALHVPVRRERAILSLPWRGCLAAGQRRWTACRAARRNDRAQRQLRRQLAAAVASMAGENVSRACRSLRCTSAGKSTQTAGIGVPQYRGTGAAQPSRARVDRPRRSSCGAGRPADRQTGRPRPQPSPQPNRGCRAARRAVLPRLGRRDPGGARAPAAFYCRSSNCVPQLVHTSEPGKLGTPHVGHVSEDRVSASGSSMRYRRQWGQMV